MLGQMPARGFSIFGFLFAIGLASNAQWLTPPEALAQQAPEPVLRIDTGGHSSYVTSLVWNRDGDELLSAGWDKLVRVWRATDAGPFVNLPQRSLRLPIGPGPSGKFDALALSDSGRWLAIGGYASLATRAASFRDNGIELPLSDVELLEQGVIYVFDREQKKLQRLEGHRGPVRQLLFATSRDGMEQLLSAGFDRSAEQKTVGSLRTWDVVQGRQLAGVLLPELPTHRPTLAAFPSPSATSGLQVLAAMGSGKMYQWETSQPPQYRRYSDGSFNSILAAPAGQPWIITASADNQTNAGQLQLWKVDNAGLPVRDIGRRIQFAQQGNEIYLPLSMALLSSRPQVTADRIAVALCVLQLNAGGNPRPERFELRVVTLPDAAGNFREELRQPLWKFESSEIRVPAMSTSPTGKYLALAGKSNHEIEIFQVDQLLRGQARPGRLKGNALTLSRAEFVERQGKIGLLLHEASDSEVGANDQTLFNFSESTIERSDGASWAAHAPDTQGWTATRSKTNANEVELRQAGMLQRTVQVPEQHVLSTYTLTGPLGARHAPLLILAAHFEGQPWLGLVDASDGLTKRVLTAHTEPISSLTVSADSQLLATTSSDQTIAVWDLSDVDALLKPRATLAGLALLTKGEVVEVNATQMAANQTADIKAGDQLLGYLDPDQRDELQTWKSMEEVNLTLWEREAGSRITIRRRRGNVDSDVVVTLQQAVDERKPLFQVMIASGDNKTDRSWIGWSPLGPFDASDREIKQRLGWHFNVPRPQTPIEFAPLDQYPDLYQPGLLDRLISQVGKAATVVPLVYIEPRMSLAVIASQDEQWNAEGTAILREAPQALTVRITNEEFSHELVQSMQLQINGKLAGSFERSEPNSWQIDSVVAAGWTRGPQLLRAELASISNPSRTIVIEKPIAYIPPAPNIALVNPIPNETKESRLSIAAKIEAGNPSEAYDVSVVRLAEDGQREILKSWTVKANDPPLAIDFPIELQEGSNRFELVARNAGANAVTEADETARVPLETFRQLRDNGPPTIRIAAVESSGENSIGKPLVLLNSQAGAPWLSESDEVLIRGNIQAVEHLTQATGQGEPLTGFVSDSSNRFEFSWPLKLQPGLNRFRLAAKTETSPLATTELEVLFREPLPEVDLASPVPDQVIADNLAESMLALRAVFQVEPNRRPLKVVAVVNGRLLDQPLNVDASRGWIEGKIPLSLGANRLQFELSNDTGAERLTRPFTIHYQPRPIVEQRQIPTEIDQPVFDVRLSGTSIVPLKRILIDNRELPKEAWQSEQDGSEFQLSIRKLAWQADQRKAVLTIFAEGVDQPIFETIDMPVLKRPAAPPQLVFLSPVDNGSVSTELLSIEYLVSSQTELSRVELNQDGQRLKLPVIEPSPSGEPSKLRQRVEVHLQPGLNTFQLMAENTDGLKARSLTVNFVPSPVALRLHSLSNAADPTIKYPLRQADDGLWRLDAPLDVARCLLSGSVRWSYADDDSLNDPNMKVWVAVNGFKQPVDLQPVGAKPLEREFTCPVQLFRASENSIDVSAPDLPELASSVARAEVDCVSPELMRQRLHLAIVGVGVDRSQEQQLMEEAIASLSGNQLQHSAKRKEFSFQSPAFSECIGYGPYTGAVVSREKIGSLLEMIRLRIQQARSRESANDVMMLYYRGGEQVNNGGQFYLTTQQTQSARQGEIIRDPLQLKYFAVSSDSLSYFVDRCPGTQLLLLDVARTVAPQETLGHQPDFIPGAATFRYAWLTGVKVPESARLITAWQSSPKPLQLDQVQQILSLRFDVLSKQYQNSVSYENHLPAPLRDLVISR
ncbi:MAG: hypothetical protein KDA72_01470 [Planctomycetales bacterium]|nr:hypothetical protein [Planctomycetales bacterium]